MFLSTKKRESRLRRRTTKKRNEKERENHKTFYYPKTYKKNQGSCEATPKEKYWWTHTNQKFYMDIHRKPHSNIRMHASPTYSLHVVHISFLSKIFIAEEEEKGLHLWFSWMNICQAEEKKMKKIFLLLAFVKCHRPRLLWSAWKPLDDVKRNQCDALLCTEYFCAVYKAE